MFCAFFQTPHFKHVWPNPINCFSKQLPELGAYSIYANIIESKNDRFILAKIYSTAGYISGVFYMNYVHNSLIKGHLWIAGYREVRHVILEYYY